MRIAAGQRVRVPLPTQPSRCYTVVGLAGPGIANLDLVVLDELGAELVSDTSESSDAQVQICADRQADYAAELVAARGGGEARIAIFAGDERDVGAESGLWLGERRANTRSPVPLDDAVRANLDGARAAGWAEPRRAAGGSLLGGQAIAHEVSLPANRCSLVIATGGRGMGRLLLRVVDEAGREVARRGGAAPSASASLCNERSARVSAELVARRGQGDYALYVLEKPIDAGLAEVPTQDRGPILDAIEDARADGLSLVGREAHDASAHDVSVRDDGGCTRVTVVAPRGAVSLRLVRDGVLVAEREGTAPSATTCHGQGQRDRRPRRCWLRRARSSTCSPSRAGRPRRRGRAAEPCRFPVREPCRATRARPSLRRGRRSRSRRPSAIFGKRLVGVMPGSVLTSSTYSFSPSVTSMSTRVAPVAPSARVRRARRC